MLHVGSCTFESDMLWGKRVPAKLQAALPFKTKPKVVSVF
jgi:hypothetical protein